MTENTAKSEMHDRPGSTVPLFLAVCTPDCNTTKVLYDCAMEAVKVDPDILVNCRKEIIAIIQPSIIEELLQDPTMSMETYKRFQILQSWATIGDESNPDDNCADPEQTSRKRNAAQMTNHLRLEDINIEELSTTVSSSGLVTEKQISDAYKAQVFRVEKRLRTVHEQLRTGYGVWKSSGTTVAAYDRDSPENCQKEIILCPILKSGIHKWSIKILEYHRELGIGVAFTSRRHGLETFLLSNGLAVRENQDSRSLYRCGLPKFSEGSVVSFTLEVEEQGGILNVSIDGGTPFAILCMVADYGDDNAGFVPAVSLCSNSRVEFLGFDE